MGLVSPCCVSRRVEAVALTCGGVRCPRPGVVCSAGSLVARERPLVAPPQQSAVKQRYGRRVGPAADDQVWQAVSGVAL